jgi:DNA invertase Pin-like site-specific DNA recombinase
MAKAIYARKSTEQEAGETGDSISIERQVENARAFAAEKKWSVADKHVYRDEAISGTRFNRPGLLAMLDAVKRGEIDTVICMDETRLGRGQWGMSKLLETLTVAKIAIWYYRTKRQLDLSTALGKFMEGVTSYSSEAYSEAVSSWTSDGLAKKARDGYATGTPPFGYKLQKVHPEREKGPKILVIDKSTADVVRRVFTMSAEGNGITKIAHKLNADPATRSLRKWSPPGVRDMLHNDTYRGVVIFGRTRTKVVDSKYVKEKVPEAAWVRVEKPELRIIDEALWHAVHARQAVVFKTFLRAKTARLCKDGKTRSGLLQGRPEASASESKHLLAGFVKCQHCGGSMVVWSQSTKGSYRYLTCGKHRSGGDAMCSNGRSIPLTALEKAVVSALKAHVTPESAERATRELAEDAAESPERAAATRDGLTADLGRLEKRIARLVDELVESSESQAIRAALKNAEAAQVQIKARLAQIDSAQEAVTAWTKAGHRERVDQLLGGWQEALSGEPVVGRQVLRKLGVKIEIKVKDNGTVIWMLAGTFGRALAGVVGEPKWVLSAEVPGEPVDLGAEIKGLVEAVEATSTLDARGGATS